MYLNSRPPFINQSTLLTRTDGKAGAGARLGHTYEFRRRFDPQNLHAALGSYSLLWQSAALSTDLLRRLAAHSSTPAAGGAACRAHAEHRGKRREHLAKHCGKLERSATRAAPQVKSSCSAALSGKVPQRHTVPASKFEPPAQGS